MWKNVALLFLFLPLLLVGQTEKNEKTENVTTYYYHNHVISIQIWFSADKKPDSTKTYYSNGKLNEVFYFDENGLKNSDCFQYNKQGEKLVTWNFSHGKLISRTDHKLPFAKDREQSVKKALKMLAELNARTNFNATSINDLYNRGVLRVSLGNNTLAMEDLKKVEYAMDKDPKNKDLIPSDSVQNKTGFLRSKLYDRMASVYALLDMESFAINYYFKAIKNAPYDCRILFSFATTLHQFGMYDLSRYYLKKILLEKSKDPQLYQAIRNLSAEMGKFERENKSKPFIAPNPAQTTISVKNFEYKNFDFEFFDFESKSVLKGKTSDGTINITGLNSGFYFLKITSGQFNQTFKVIKE